MTTKRIGDLPSILETVVPSNEPLTAEAIETATKEIETILRGDTQSHADPMERVHIPRRVWHGYLSEAVGPTDTDLKFDPPEFDEQVRSMRGPVLRIHSTCPECGGARCRQEIVWSEDAASWARGEGGTCASYHEDGAEVHIIGVALPERDVK